MDEGAGQTHWINGRIVDDEPRPPDSASAWAWLLAVLALVFAVDLALGLGAPAEGELAEPHAKPHPEPHPELTDAAALRAELEAAAAAARAGRPSYLLVGDSVLAGEVMAEHTPDWRSLRVIDHMRAELGSASEAALRQVALDGLLPVDALHLLAELDRLDPAGEVELVLELDLRYFSAHYADRTGCSRPELCELGRTQLAAEAPSSSGPSSAPSILALASLGLVESAALARDWLARRAPIRRHRPQLRAPSLAELEGLVVARTEPGLETELESPRARGLARVGEHYRGATLEAGAQVEALAALVERLAARGRSATLFLTPLEDGFAAASLPGNRLGRRYEQLATLVHDRSPKLRLIDLDHPLFESAYFLDHVHLDPAGNRLLALNLLHELGLPLRTRPFEWMMVHDEDHDRSLVHRRGVGYADGGAWRALFRGPEGVAVSRSGDWIVIADTGNHALRQLRGGMQIVERLAGVPTRGGHLDGPARAARLWKPRSPEILGEAVYFLDGRHAERVRELVGGEVRTLRFAGPSCERHRELEARDVNGRPWLYLLCADDRIFALDLDARRATLAFDPRTPGNPVRGLRAIEPTDDGRLLIADDDSRIWAVELDPEGRGGRPRSLFENTASELLPQAYKLVYPFGFDEMRVNRIVGMEWVERYGALLIQDEHDLVEGNSRLCREQTERVHLRLLDLDSRLIYPWIKAIPHAEAFHMWNAITGNLVSYFHLGAMAVVQDDASLVYLERRRSRLLRLADGLLAVAKSGSLHTTWSKVELLQPIGTGTAEAVSASMRPDRFLATRHEPLPRTGPYVALLVGSSLSTISDRLGNYSLGRLLEVELQAELGYRDGIRLDLYQRAYPAASLKSEINGFEEFLTAAGPPPDVVLFELHDFSSRFLRHTKTPAERIAQLARVERLAARYDTLVIFYDNSAIDSNDRDGLRATSTKLRGLIGDIRKLGFVILEPSDRLLRELLVESPWGNQPWGRGQHHGSPWAVELTAKCLASMAAPVLREFLRGREPARLRERDPADFNDEPGTGAARLAKAFERSSALVEREALPELRRSYLQREYAERELELFVDLAGFDEVDRSEAGLEAVALAVLYAELEDEIYGELAERVRVELLEFRNYDEYGAGVRESAEVVWQASLDVEQLDALIRRVAARQGADPQDEHEGQQP